MGLELNLEEPILNSNAVLKFARLLIFVFIELVLIQTGEDWS